MKIKQTDLAQYELLHGDTTYDFDFKPAPSTELLIDVYADRPCSLFLHIVRDSIDKWVNVISGERRLDFRGRFANCVGARIHTTKECTLNAFVGGHPVGVDGIDYTPRTAKLQIPEPSLAELVAKEVRKMLPQKTPREVHPDPELMGDEIAEKFQGYEIDDDDPLDGDAEQLHQDDAVGDSGRGDDTPRTDPDPGSADTPASAPADPEPTA